MILWEPEVLARIRHLTLTARATVDGIHHGLHPSRAVGGAAEFEDYKEYTPGDPLRDLDWRVAARSDRLVIRRHRGESLLPSWIALDCSGDMGTGQGRPGARPPLDAGKLGYALTLSATLAWYLTLQGEPVGLCLLGGQGSPWELLQPRRGRRHLGRVLGCLASVSAAGRAELGVGLASLAGHLHRSSLVVLVSDLMEPTEAWAPALLGLARRKSEARVLHVLDPAELDLRFPRAARLFSPEGGPDRPVDPAELRPGFREVVRAWRAEVEGAVLAGRGAYVAVPTDRPLAEPLLRLLGLGARRSAG
ncbi:MAG: DUF58 domain-containing protein [Pseudomonadota bacterium]